MCAGCKYEMTAKIKTVPAVYNKNKNSRSSINLPCTSIRCISEITNNKYKESTVYAQLYTKFF